MSKSIQKAFLVNELPARYLGRVLTKTITISDKVVLGVFTQEEYIEE